MTIRAMIPNPNISVLIINKIKILDMRMVVLIQQLPKRIKIPTMIINKIIQSKVFTNKLHVHKSRFEIDRNLKENWITENRSAMKINTVNPNMAFDNLQILGKRYEERGTLRRNFNVPRMNKSILVSYNLHLVKTSIIKKIQTVNGKVSSVHMS